tara:strand:- start:331 stop:762 length:432 start_codon:yes stop_codon:yes gene_type:complete
VVGGHEDAVEVGVSGHDGVEVVVGGEGVLAVLLVKVGLDDGLDDAERVIGALVKVGADLLENVVRDVVERIRRDDVCGVEWGGNASEVGVHRGEAGSGRKDKGVAFFQPQGCIAGPAPGAPSRLTTTGAGVETAARTTIEREL